MATRLDVQARRKSLYDNLKRSCLDGTLAPGVMLPSVRELGDQYGVSANVVFGVIKSLTDEGMIYTLPRVGAFVGRPHPQTIEPYLMIVPQRETRREGYWVQAQLGFEDRIAQLGGHSIVLTPEEAELHLQRSDLPPLSGVFGTDRSESAHLFHESGIPRVLFGIPSTSGESADRISFDDIGGGALATRHLLQNGHRNIAFLALHNPDSPSIFSWSLRREQGWKKEMLQGGIETISLAFHPQLISDFTPEEQIETSREIARQLIGRTEITAVVTANILAAQGMFEAFQQVQWPAEKWPAVVCFDAAPGSTHSVVSYLRLPWEDIGREAAQLLWERRSGRLTGEPVHREVPMRLIPRLSCRSDWATSSGLAQSRVSRPVSSIHSPHQEAVAGLSI